MVHLRLARKDDREEIPLHYEGLEIARTVRSSGWISGLSAVLAGIVTMVRFPGSGADVFGALLASMGAVVLAAVIRCRRCETIVGKRWLRLRCGPFRSDVPTNLVAGGVIRTSTGWRRHYARQEVVVGLGTGQSGPILPSADPEDLVHVLETSS